MGYTHYWDHTKAFSDEQWKDIVNAYADLLQATVNRGISISIRPDEQPCSAHELLAERQMLLTTPNQRIFFNGTGDLSHETFVLTQHNGGFEFCKTAMKPYDTLVTAFLCYLGTHYHDHIRISSDGDADDWQEGLTFANDVFSTPVHLPGGLTPDDDEENEDA